MTAGQSIHDIQSSILIAQYSALRVCEEIAKLIQFTRRHKLSSTPQMIFDATSRARRPQGTGGRRWRGGTIAVALCALLCALLYAGWASTTARFKL